MYRGWGVLGILVGMGIAGCGSTQETTGASPTGTAAGAQNTTSKSGSNPASASDAEMRKSFEQKSFSIDQVPAKDRDRVQAIMDAQKNRTK